MSKQIKNRSLFVADPIETIIPNDGVAEVSAPRTEQEINTLRYELQSFVCEGEYSLGLERILRSYVSNYDRSDQPAVWVSGFYGSGKSHLVKVLRYLWVDYEFPDGATARGLAKLPSDITDLLREMDILGKRAGGLHAAAGKLSPGATNIRLALLAIIFRSVNLPEEYPIARLVLWMKDNNILDKVQEIIGSAKKDFDKELRSMYVSPLLAEALLTVMPDLAHNQGEVRALLKAQFPLVNNISNEQMYQAIVDAIAIEGEIPATLVVLDELQQYIGDNGDRAYEVQLVTEECCKRFGGRLLFVATGQSALVGTENLHKLKHRYTVNVEFSDTDVENVTRKVVLDKKPALKPEITKVLQSCSGEIDRHLSGTKIGPRHEDASIMVADYPILPVRHRFWEKILRSIDRAGTAGQLRTQLRIMHEAARSVAEKELGTVVPADFIFDQLSAEMLQSSVLLRNVDEIIRKQRNGSHEGILKSRLCALIFLISQLTRESGTDTGIRSTPDVLADLLVEDLIAGSSELRKDIPPLLQELLDAGDLMPVDDEYRIQTPEGAAWDGEYNRYLVKLSNDTNKMAEERSNLLRNKCVELLKDLRKNHGESKVIRKAELFFGSDEPRPTSAIVPIWIRDGWTDSESTVLREAREAGVDSPVIFVFLPRQSAAELKNAIAGLRAAEQTLDLRGIQTTSEGQEARTAMETRQRERQINLNRVLEEIIKEVRVYQAGGDLIQGLTLRESIEETLKNSIARMFTGFSIADSKLWEKVFERAKKGDPTPLAVLNYQGETAQHPVCARIMTFLATSKKGSVIRQEFMGVPFGWSQDAVDGALMALCRNELISAVYNGNPMSIETLEHGKIGITQFKLITVVVTPSQRIALRKLYQIVGINCKPNEELGTVAAFIQATLELANTAGGEAPAPRKPDTAYVQELKQLVGGNELLVAIYERRQELTADIQKWQHTSKEIEKRLSRWKVMQQLLEEAQGFSVSSTIKPQVDAILAQRSLLDEPDSIPSLCENLTQELREALKFIQARFKEKYDAEIASLDQGDVWQQLNPDQQEELLLREGLGSIPAVQLGTEMEILKSLQQRPLDKWRDQVDAIPQRFSRVVMAATRSLQPAAVAVKLPSITLNNETEVDLFLQQMKDMIMSHIDEGHPVVI